MQKERGFSTDSHGYVSYSGLHDKAVVSFFYSDETKIFRLSVHGLHGDNTRVDVCLEGVVQITISNIINGSICEGLYAWEIKDAFDHYGDNAQGRLGLS